MFEFLAGCLCGAVSLMGLAEVVARIEELKCNRGPGPYSVDHLPLRRSNRAESPWLDKVL